MPPKKPEEATARVLTRQVTQDQGITLEWQPFGHGCGVDVSEVEDAQNVVRQLKDEDAKRRLYTFSKSQAKSSIPYPVFKSRDEDHIHKFVKETKELFIRNRVPISDQARILRTNLKGFAPDIVHKDITNIETAYKLLIKQHGGAAKYKIFLSECEGYWPGLQNPKQRYQKISKIVAQLEELETLITDGSVNKAELYNAVSVKKLLCQKNSYAK